MPALLQMGVEGNLRGQQFGHGAAQLGAQGRILERFLGGAGNGGHQGQVDGRDGIAAIDFSRLTSAVVFRAVARMPASPSWPDRAIVKQAAWAAPISSSGLLPGPSSKRVLKP